MRPAEGQTEEGRFLHMDLKVKQKTDIYLILKK